MACTDLACATRRLAEAMQQTGANARQKLSKNVSTSIASSKALISGGDGVDPPRAAAVQPDPAGRQAPVRLGRRQPGAASGQRRQGRRHQRRRAVRRPQEHGPDGSLAPNALLNAANLTLAAAQLGRSTKQSAKTGGFRTTCWWPHAPSRMPILGGGRPCPRPRPASREVTTKKVLAAAPTGHHQEGAGRRRAHRPPPRRCWPPPRPPRCHASRRAAAATRSVAASSSILINMAGVVIAKPDPAAQTQLSQATAGISEAVAALSNDATNRLAPAVKEHDRAMKLLNQSAADIDGMLLTVAMGNPPANSALDKTHRWPTRQGGAGTQQPRGAGGAGATGRSWQRGRSWRRSGKQMELAAQRQADGAGGAAASRWSWRHRCKQTELAAPWQADGAGGAVASRQSWRRRGKQMELAAPRQADRAGGAAASRRRWQRRKRTRQADEAGGAVPS